MINIYIQILCIKHLLGHILTAQASKGLDKRKTKVGLSRVVTYGTDLIVSDWVM